MKMLYAIIGGLLLVLALLDMLGCASAPKESGKVILRYSEKRADWMERNYRIAIQSKTGRVTYHDIPKEEYDALKPGDWWEAHD